MQRATSIKVPSIMSEKETQSRMQEVNEKLNEIERRAALTDAEHCRVITRRLNEIRDLIDMEREQ